MVDKPAGPTSHDVVARCRRIFGTRRVGHAGTLDPLATGVLLVGIGRATRLLGRLALADKEYDASVRLGQSTLTDDAEGEITGRGDASALSEEAIRAAAEKLTGDLLQRPSAVSAVKVAGQRAHRRVRAGEEVVLAPRPVTVRAFEVVGVRRDGQLVDVEVVVACSTGTYVRALARDLGEALGVGGHLTRLRRTRVGPYHLSDARSLDDLAADPAVVPLSEVARASFPAITVDDEAAAAVRVGRPVPIDLAIEGPIAVFVGAEFLALYERSGELAKPVAVFVG